MLGVSQHNPFDGRSLLPRLPRRSWGKVDIQSEKSFAE
jgi:hypothetical protein